MKVLIPLALSILCPIPSPAQMAGTWEGTLKFPTQTLRLVLHISGADNKLTATNDSPDQYIWDSPLASITLSGSVLNFVLGREGGSFTGDVTPDGTIVGTFTQRGNGLPLLLARSAGVPRVGPDTTSSVTNGRYHNDWTGLEFSLPEGFTVVETETSSNASGMQADLTAPILKGARVAVWMRKRGMYPENIAGDLAGQVQPKIQRRGGAAVGYSIPENGIQRLTIDGQQALRATAYFTAGQSKKTSMVELLAWISTEHNLVHFYAMIPADEMAMVQPAFDQMVMSAQLP